MGSNLQRYRVNYKMSCQTANTTLENDIEYMKKHFPFLLPDEHNLTIVDQKTAILSSENVDEGIENFNKYQYDQNGIRIVKAKSIEDYEMLIRDKILKLESAFI